MSSIDVRDGSTISCLLGMQQLLCGAAGLALSKPPKEGRRSRSGITISKQNGNKMNDPGALSCACCTPVPGAAANEGHQPWAPGTPGHWDSEKQLYLGTRPSQYHP
ncbi:Protein Smg7 [Manis pentadactyla]|nr:Protein Smg7 [Manis pentadactyla]